MSTDNPTKEDEGLLAALEAATIERDAMKLQRDEAAAELNSLKRRVSDLEGQLKTAGGKGKPKGKPKARPGKYCATKRRMRNPNNHTQVFYSDRPTDVVEVDGWVQSQLDAGLLAPYK